MIFHFRNSQISQTVTEDSVTFILDSNDGGKAPALELVSANGTRHRLVVGFPVVVLVQVVVSNSAVLDASAVSLVELDPQAAEVVVNRLSRVPELVAAKEVVPRAVYLRSTLAFVNPRQHWQG